jgi:hypothetical protein
MNNNDQNHSIYSSVIGLHGIGVCIRKASLERNVFMQGKFFRLIKLFVTLRFDVSSTRVFQGISCETEER